MKKILKTIIIVLSCFSVYAQKENLNQTKYQFAQRVFEKEYSETVFEKFRGRIIIENENTIKFDEKTLTLNVNKEYIDIFTSGLFYPNLITGNHIVEIKSQEELDKMTKDEKLFYNLSRTDSLTISNLQELYLLNPNYQTKRFCFWIFRPGRANAQEWYFELQNKKATKNTKLSDFIKNAKLTFCKSGTIII
ncbi:MULTISPECIES: hypothetical protein [Flavobacterium]|uniref:hypothetical protein n=1 Tax=Flavobacterium TaxID=237 RepID=UPI001FCB4CED|nr:MULTISPECIES: hypothetical protein [Flavobacterium]UOK42234.1 hypothetical protein LZF87_13060 [Flavobacterium enshiense]